MNTKKIGIIGWGGRGGHCAKSGYEATQGKMIPVACVETDPSRYDIACEELSLKPKCYASVPEMMEHEDLDGIIIATPNEFHFEHLIESSKNNIPILLEKPLEASFEKVCEVLRFSKNYQGEILVGHCMRFAPILHKAKEILKQKRLGNIISARFVQNCFYGDMGYHNWRRNVQKSGSWLMEKATHDFDIMLWLLESFPEYLTCLSGLNAFGGNEPNDLHCRKCIKEIDCLESVGNTLNRWGIYKEHENYGRNDLCVYAKEVNNPDLDHCIIKFKNGIIASYEQNFFAPMSYKSRVYEIHGDQGFMEIDLGHIQDGGKISLHTRYGLQGDVETHTFDYQQQGHYNGDRPMGKHFYDIMNGNSSAQTTVHQAFLAELVSYTAIEARKDLKYIEILSLLPEDLIHDFYDNPYHHSQ